eukprot:scaffold3070_cov1604-Pavlova_lutheri.AAC.7
MGRIHEASSLPARTVEARQPPPSGQIAQGDTAQTERAQHPTPATRPQATVAQASRRSLPTKGAQGFLRAQGARARPRKAQGLPHQTGHFGAAQRATAPAVASQGGNLPSAEQGAQPARRRDAHLQIRAGPPPATGFLRLEDAQTTPPPAETKGQSPPQSGGNGKGLKVILPWPTLVHQLFEQAQGAGAAQRGASPQGNTGAQTEARTGTARTQHLGVLPRPQLQGEQGRQEGAPILSGGPEAEVHRDPIQARHLVQVSALMFQEQIGADHRPIVPIPTCGCALGATLRTSFKADWRLGRGACGGPQRAVPTPKRRRFACRPVAPAASGAPPRSWVEGRPHPRPARARHCRRGAGWRALGAPRGHGARCRASPWRRATRHRWTPPPPGPRRRADARAAPGCNGRAWRRSCPPLELGFLLAWEGPSSMHQARRHRRAVSQRLRHALRVFQGEAFHLDEHLPCFHVGHPTIESALALAHAHLGRFARARELRKDAEPELPSALAAPIESAAQGFQRRSFQTACAQRHESVLASTQGAAIGGDSAGASLVGLLGGPSLRRPHGVPPLSRAPPVMRPEASDALAPFRGSGATPPFQGSGARTRATPSPPGYPGPCRLSPPRNPTPRASSAVACVPSAKPRGAPVLPPADDRCSDSECPAPAANRRGDAAVGAESNARNAVAPGRAPPVRTPTARSVPARRRATPAPERIHPGHASECAPPG